MTEVTDFFPGAIVSLDNEYGVVLNSSTTGNSFGLIRWDTPRENDVEDWTGVLGAFIQIGGRIIQEDYQFTYINPDGSSKK